MPTCFVVMGFGERTDPATGRKLNLDMTYRNIIQPAIQAAGYTCERADEIRHSSVIDIPMYDRLFSADLVVADLSTSNLNATFELGLRYALKPRSTIVIAEKQFTSPFDVNHILINRYEHLGTDIGYTETLRMQRVVRELVTAIGAQRQPDSPVYCFMRDLQPPQKIPRYQLEPPLMATRAAAALRTVAPEDSYASRLAEAMDAIRQGHFELAKSTLADIYDSQTVSTETGQSRIPRSRVVQALALATYKAADQSAATIGLAGLEAAYETSIDLLSQLQPEQTVDPETLGLWSAVHKRRSQLATRSEEQRRRDIETAIYASERGFLIRQDHYNGVNLAYLLDFRASLSTGNDRIADRVLADRVRRRVIAFAQAELARINDASQEGVLSEQLRDQIYWCEASLAEALAGLGDPAADQALERAKSHAAHTWMLEITLSQVAKVKELRAQ